MAKKRETKKEKKVKSGDRKLYMLECISIHKVRYVIETDEKGVQEFVDKGWDLDCDLSEFSQDHTGERVIAVHPIDKATYLKWFDEDNNYLRSWDDEQKFTFINKK